MDRNRTRRRRRLRIAAAAVAVVLVAVGMLAGAAILVSRPGGDALAAEHVDPLAGVALRPPEAWTRHRWPLADASVLFEYAHRPAVSPWAVRGLWMARWSGSEGDLKGWAADPDLPAVDDVQVAGLRAVRRVEPVGPGPLGLLPDLLSQVRVKYRMHVDGSIFELGFWVAEPEAGSQLERAVVRSLRLFEPAYRRIEQERFRLEVPGRWTLDPEREVPSVFAAEAPGSPVDGWAHVFEREGASLADTGDRLLAAVSQNPALSGLTRSDTTLAGGPAIHVHFSVEDTDPSLGAPDAYDIDEYLVEAPSGGYLLLALGRRGDARAAELDRIRDSFRPT